MRNSLTIAGKELASFMGSAWSWIVVAVFLAVTGYGFGFSPATFAETSLQGFLSWGGFFLLLMCPALTMRLFAEEEKLGTIELLLTSPVRDFEIVIGKYLASLGMLALMLGFSLYFPLLLAIYGSPDPGPIISGYLGLFLLGALYLSAGLFASTLSANQIVAFILGSAACFFLWFIGMAAAQTGPAARGLLALLSISTYYPDFSRGIIDTNAVIYFISLTGVFIFITVRSLETRRWR